MNALEHQLDYPFADTLPEPGQPFEVAPGLYWLRMPLPFALDHINLWLLRDEIDGEAGWTIVDSGIASDTIKGHWEHVFDTALGGLPVLRVIVTHCHPDHLGLAHWLCEGGDKKRWNVRLWMTLGEYLNGRVLAAGDGSNAGGAGAARHFARHGLTDEASLAKLRERRGYYSNLVPAIPTQYRRLREADTVTIGARRWRVVTGFGHSPEHCALYSEADDVLISGDMVLPRISTNVSVFDIEPEGNPLALYLESLGRYETMPERTLALPSHGKPFRGVSTRIAQLRAHHDARLAEVLDACASAPRCASDIVPIMFKRQLDIHQMTFAMGEALAHLHLLWLDGKLKRATGDDGVIRFAV
ncbi:MBL fold metallo-hydrolase [Paraburkholderia caballeronis]|uniref:Glyoxylase, beta-lactamase superfamily II n=1 Tax=Paraburkholderia caballeronis TaxID=416943 RepID=A0A1H7THH6_9BURK|nr:MBL fold metallo-hydrolase [Paraburkholderia caballeronis]PXW18383.1 glyoxylase-like metal-dependent hydrolase (beta-lactamase superfamily II) [Paraburkholderia caballeronis]PXW95663.1 glyoxylase-like metal-dependent hydrolase (beta-lactamase superfamily II) [Paraburkholderia caballeronis]RAJ92009.1 glyoxylase-like metal-dependent hydrolase (beta-lactamase superfamily II) [Paraburkholderia caballeronis]SEB78781.1 Glyoxylase, beta-lactamase superfamily II [Paraburkholderia caballeronis]SEL84